MQKQLKVGDKAPSFSTTDQNGNIVNSNDFKGKRLMLYFYPKDNTPGCTAQACNIKDNFSELEKHNIQVIGVSIDDEKSHKKFEEKFALPFTLLADTEKKIVQDFGLWGLKKFMGKEYMGTSRATFLINEEGIIEHIIDKVDTKDHVNQVLNVWNLI